MVRNAAGIIVSLLMSSAITVPASAEQCSAFENVKGTIKKADTKQAIIAALIMIEPLSGSEVDSIIGSFPEADDFRPRALEEVEKKMIGCTKDPQ